MFFFTVHSPAAFSTASRYFSGKSAGSRISVVTARTILESGYCSPR